MNYSSNYNSVKIKLKLNNEERDIVTLIPEKYTHNTFQYINIFIFFQKENQVEISQIILEDEISNALINPKY